MTDRAGRGLSSNRAAVRAALALLLGCLSAHASAGPFCFALANSYYEQMYCEIKAKGRGAQLPAYQDFRKNDPTTQALLLKPHARAVGLALVMPRGRRSLPDAPAPAKPPAQRSTATAAGSAPASRAAGGPLAHCEIQSASLRCSGRVYRLLGNRPNAELEPGSLSASNRLDLNDYRGDWDDRAALQRHIDDNYRRYIEGMLSIGLAGSTQTYRRFAGLFYDYAELGVSFSERYESVFGYLKQDKRSIPIRAGLPDIDALELENCRALDNALISCELGLKNALFRAGKS